MLILLLHKGKKIRREKRKYGVESGFRKLASEKKVEIRENIWEYYLQIETNAYICIRLQQANILKYQAGVVELVDTLDLGSSALRCGSSSLPARTD